MGAWCSGHPLVVIGLWLAATTVLVTLAATTGGRLSQGETVPGTEVHAADAQLAAHFPAASDTTAVVVLHGPDRAGVSVAASHVIAGIRRLPHVVASSVRESAVSRDGRTALVNVRYDSPRFSLHPSDLHALQAVARSAPPVEGQVSGDLFYQLNVPSNGVAEKVGIGLAVLVLLFAFGSVIAALMPVATAALGIITGLSLVHLLANWYAVNDSAPALATMLGLGAGIDYALFIVTRHREGMRSGLRPAEAATAAMSSAGSSVVWAGVTVVAAICGLAFGGIPVVTSLGLASAVVVAMSVLSALTMLPALLSLTDVHIDRLHIPLPHLRHERVGSRELRAAGDGAEQWSWARWARVIERRPVRYVVGCSLLLVVLAVPVAGMRLGMPDSSSAPAGSDAKRAFTLIDKAFGPGVDAPLQLVVTMPRVRTIGEVESALRSAVSADADVAAVGPMATSNDGTTATMTVTPRSGAQSNSTAELIPRLRDTVLPRVERATGARVLVTGLPAGRYDVGQRVLDRLPYFVGAVLALSFVLLMLVFRSLLVPLKAVLLNVLSIAAALGVIVAVFTWGWLRQLVGVSETVPIVDVVPMIMFAIVFGLSMDYEVFLLSRVREEWLAGGDARGSVVRGLTSTGRVISAAAAIMVSVFLAFTLSHDVIVKMVGLGLAVAVFLDATVIRLALVPATMSLLGDLNWWLPRWLDRLLPHVDIDAVVPVTLVDPVMPQVTDAPIARPTA